MSFLIRKCPDQSLLPAPRTLSQAVASFIASMNQGIHYYALRLLLGNLKITSKHIFVCSPFYNHYRKDFLFCSAFPAETFSPADEAGCSKFFLELFFYLLGKKYLNSALVQNSPVLFLNRAPKRDNVNIFSKFS